MDFHIGERIYIYFVNYVNTNLNLLENLFYRNPNLNWVGSFSCYIYVIIASIMILENIFFPVALIFLKFCHIEGNDCSRPDMKYFSVTIWWSAGHNLLCWYCWYDVVQSAVLGSQILALPSISLLTDGKCLTSSVAEESIPHCSDRVSKLPGTSANIELVPFIIYTMFNFIFSLTIWLQISREIFIIFQHLCFLELLGQMSSFMRLFFIL